jgi:hypothetical protein
MTNRIICHIIKEYLLINGRKKHNSLKWPVDVNF